MPATVDSGLPGATAGSAARAATARGLTERKAFWLRVANIDIHRCSECGGTLCAVGFLPPARGPP